MPVRSAVVCSVAAAVASMMMVMPPDAQSDQGARMERLADGVYAIIHRDATRDWPAGTTAWPHGNTGVIVGDDGVLVVDATYLPSRAQADIALIRQLTKKPVRYLVNTHWHGDHTHGNGVYVAAFPGLTILGARENRQFVDINLERRRSYGRSPVAGLATIAHLDSILRAGKDSTGRTLGAQEKRELETTIAERKTELEELAKIEIAPPNLVFDDKITVFLGKRRIDVQNRGRANSPADLTVYVPDEKVIFTGDIVVLPAPFAFGSNPVPWIGALRAIEATPITSLVPGHGPVQHDVKYVTLVRELFETGAARLEVLARQNLNADDAKSRFSLDDFRPKFVRPGDENAKAYWDSMVPGLFEDLWACVRGSRC